MNYRLPLRLALLAVTVTALHAAPSDDDDEDIDYLGYYSKSRSRITFGYQMRQGAKVHFGNLGIVQRPLTTTLSTGQVISSYTNGTVSTDVLRSDEKNTDGSQSSTPGGRYITKGTDANNAPIVTGSKVAFKTGQTRYWGYTNTSQITPDGSHIVLDQYSATSAGANFEGKRKLSSGVELQLARQFTRDDSRIAISLVGGLSLNSLSSKQSGNVHSNLHVVSDTYATVGGVAVPHSVSGAYLAPTYDPFTQTDGTINPQGTETTVPLSLNPTSTSRDAAGAANVNGVWRINGAYYAMRFGPQFTARLTNTIALNAGVGVTGAYVGTNYTANETLVVVLDGVDTPTNVQDSSTKGKFLPGYYANLDALWEANERTGFFAGLNYEALGSYDQKVAGRTAKIDIGNTVGIRGGISIKF